MNSIYITNLSVGATKFSWYLNDSLISTDKDFSFIQMQSNYPVFLKLEASNDCNSSATFTKFVGIVRESINEFELIHISLSPNPVSSILNLQTDEYLSDESIKIRILDVLGKEETLLRTNLSNGKMSIDVSQLSNGFHFLQLQTSRGNSIQKFVKE
jgi:hypothetical protein